MNYQLRQSAQLTGMLGAVVYLIAGKLGLAFAPGGGYASLLFPPAGIALGLALVLGRGSLAWVFLGAFILNATQGGIPTNLESGKLLVATAIALASAFQAGIGATLMHRHIPDLMVMDSGVKAIRLVGLAAVVCLTSSSLSTLSIMLFGAAEISNFEFIWITWWLGDLLGVVIFLPLTLAWLATSSESWRAMRRPLTVAVCVGLAAIGPLTHQVANWESERAKNEFLRISINVADRVQAHLAEQISFVDQLAAVMSGPNRVDEREFTRLAGLAKKHFASNVQAIEWASLVKHPQREAFEHALRYGNADYRITERAVTGALQQALPRANYLPVTFIYPKAGNEQALGFDLASNSSRQRTIDLAEQTGRAVATPPVSLVQETSDQKGILVLKWAAGTGNGKGLVLVVLRMGDFMRSMHPVKSDMVQVRLMDVSVGENGVLYDEFMGDATHDNYVQPFTAGERRYLLETRPTTNYLEQHRSWITWGVQSGGLMLISVIVWALVVGISRTAQIEALVRDRTTQLRQREKYLRAVIDNLPFLFWLKDKESRFLAVNTRFSAACGAENPEGVVGKNDFDIWPEDLARKYREDDHKVMILETDKCVEEEVHSANGHIWIETYKKPVIDDNGEVLGTVGYARDITDRRSVEQALRDSQARWELAVRGANDGIWDWQPKSGYLYCSGRWKGMLGLPADKNIDNVTVWESRIHPDDRDRVLHELDAHLHGKREFYQCEYRLRHEDGGYLWVLDRGKALFDSSGNALRMAGSLSDISDRRAAESHAQERREQLDTIFSLSPDGFVSFSKDGCVQYVNPAFTRLTGLEEKTVLGLDESQFDQKLAGLCEASARYRGTEALRTGLVGGSVRELIELHAPKSCTLEVSLRLSNSEVIAQVLYFRDVTHETEVDRMKSDFLSTAAHELRTPMASIYGFSEVLLGGEFDPATSRELLGIIHTQSERMADIINELLDLARIEARRGKDFRIERLNINDLLVDAAAGFKVPVGRSQPSISGDLARYWLRGDRGKLIQAFSNVIANAYKYSPNGGQVSISLEEKPSQNMIDGQVGITIVDHGIGMSPEQLERVCEAFYRADTSGNIPGTGLGMSIVKEIIELHGGSLSLASKPGEGTSVTLWLPLESVG